MMHKTPKSLSQEIVSMQLLYWYRGLARSDPFFFSSMHFLLTIVAHPLQIPVLRRKETPLTGALLTPFLQDGRPFMPWVIRPALDRYTTLSLLSVVHACADLTALVPRDSDGEIAPFSFEPPRNGSDAPEEGTFKVRMRNGVGHLLEANSGASYSGQCLGELESPSVLVEFGLLLLGTGDHCK